MSKQPFSWRTEGSFREDLGVLGLSTVGIPLRQKVGAQSAIQHFCFDCHLFYIPIKGYMMPPPVHSWYIGFKTHWTALLILVEASFTCLPQKCFTVCTAVTGDPHGIHPTECFLWDFRGKSCPHNCVSTEHQGPGLQERILVRPHHDFHCHGEQSMYSMSFEVQASKDRGAIPPHL